MRAFSRTILALGIFLGLTAMSAHKKIRVVFFGDSITEAGAKPGGFIEKINAALEKRGLASQYELIGAGVGGNKVYDLYLRMDDDVMAKKPDVVFIWIGVNDVWHKLTSGTGTDPDKFAKFYNAIIDKMRDKGIRVILVTPAVIGEKTDFTNQQDGDLNRYSQIIRDLAKAQHCDLVDMREVFHTYDLKNNPGNKESGILTVDRVHLTDQGNQLAADNMLDALLAR